jgi:hypothetical protein
MPNSPPAAFKIHSRSWPSQLINPAWQRRRFMLQGCSHVLSFPISGSNVGLTPQPPCEHNPQSVVFGQSDTVLIMFCLLPFLFPFYLSSLLEGGRAWILEMLIGSPVVQQATLCQSSYFFSLLRRIAERDVVWESVLAQIKYAFGLLKQSLQVLDGSNTMH